MFIGSGGLILIGIGLGDLGVGQTANSAWSSLTSLLGHPATSQLVDTSVSSVYLSWGLGLVIISALAYVIPKIFSRRY